MKTRITGSASAPDLPGGARNAPNMEMCLALLASSREIAAHEEVRGVFVRASGPAFCAGAPALEIEPIEEQLKAGNWMGKK